MGLMVEVDRFIPDEAPLPRRGLSALTDLNDLEVFARVVEKSGFSRAARELGVPASTVSRRVARLEEGLGVRLLQRTTRTMHLTEAGRIYFERISRALRDIEGAEASLKVAQGTPRGLVRLSMISEPFADAVLFDFMREYPEVVLEIDKSHGRVDLVKEGFDLALRAGALPDSSLLATKLMTSGPVLCAAPSYLKRRGTPKTAGELRDHDCVILGTSATAMTWLLSNTEGGTQRISVSGRIAVNHFATAVDACMRGLGIGLFPAGFIEHWVERGDLTLILPELSPPPGGIWIVHPTNTLLAPAVRVLIDYLKDAFRGGTPQKAPELLALARKEK